MCNDVLNNCVIINGMNKPCHESLIRLYEAAIESKKIDSETPTDLAKSPPFPCQIPAISHLNHCFCELPTHQLCCGWVVHSKI